MVDYARLRSSTEQIAYRLEAVTPRRFELSDVNWDGNDTVYEDRTFPPAADTESSVIVRAFDGITDFGQVRGDVSSGVWGYSITIPEYVADFEDHTGGYLYASTVHGGALGVIGVAGTDGDEVMLCKAFMRGMGVESAYAEDTLTFRLESSAAFLRDSQFSRGWDWASGLDHSAPVTLGDAIAHTINQHTNFTPRSGYSVYLPDTTFVRLSHNGGSVLDVLRGLAKNVCLEPWVFSTREDDLVITGHPNCVGPAVYSNGTSTLASPAIELDDTLVMRWKFDKTFRGAAAAVTVSAMTSDGTELGPAVSYRAGGVGTRPKAGPIRLDDAALLQDIADRYLDHLNRSWSGTIETTVNLVPELGDIITVTKNLTQYNTNWVQKPFVVTAIGYSTNLQTGEFTATYTVDEVLE